MVGRVSCIQKLVNGSVSVLQGSLHCVHVYMHNQIICICRPTHRSMYIYEYRHFVLMSPDLYIHIYMSLYSYIYVYMYMSVYIYIYMYIRITR